jgi:hypothetical protein
MAKEDKHRSSKHKSSEREREREKDKDRKDRSDKEKSKAESKEVKAVIVGDYEKKDAECKTVKHKKVASDTESEPESEESEGSYDEEASAEDDRADSDDELISLSSTEMLSNDPLYFVLSRLLVSKDGNNLVDVLESISKKLDKLIQKA